MLAFGILSCGPVVPMDWKWMLMLFHKHAVELEKFMGMRRSGGKYPEGTVSAHLTYRCCANIPTRCYKPMYDDYEKIGNGKYKVINWETEIKEVEQDDKF